MYPEKGEVVSGWSLTNVLRYYLAPNIFAPFFQKIHSQTWFISSNIHRKKRFFIDKIEDRILIVQ